MNVASRVFQNQIPLRSVEIALEYSPIRSPASRGSEDLYHCRSISSDSQRVGRSVVYRLSHCESSTFDSKTWRSAPISHAILLDLRLGLFSFSCIVSKHETSYRSKFKQITNCLLIVFWVFASRQSRGEIEPIYVHCNRGQSL